MTIDDGAVVAAVILAGRSPAEDDPLAGYSLGRPKGLIPIVGRPMICYVMEALAGSRYIRHIVVVGLDPADCPPLPAQVEHLPDQGGMLANAEGGLRHAASLLPDVDGVLVASADLPLLTPAIVDDFVEACLETDHDLYYSVVERSVMEGRFPASRRTYLRLAEGQFAGGDLLIVRPGVVTANRELWERLASARKSPIRQARMLGGVWPLARLLAGRISLPEAERRASRALNLRGRVMVCAHPELGMDVDKPYQLEIARNELEARLGAASS